MNRFVYVMISVLTVSSCRVNQRTKLHHPEILEIDSLKISKIDSAFSNYDDTTPGFAVAVLQNNRVVFMKSYGMADPKRKVRVTSETRFPIGSNTKQFTCMSILLLQESGKLNINDPVKKYLPQLPGYGDTVTIKQLMQHTSGIIEYNPLLFLSDSKKNECGLTNSDILDLVSRYPKTSSKAGEKFFYSNTGYILLARIIEIASGKTYPNFINENIFVPLGMTNSLVVASASDYKDIALGFSGMNTARPVNCPMVTTGGSGVITTIEDLSKWVKNFHENKLGTSGQALINKMVTCGLLNNGDSTKYGLGLFIDSYCGLTMYWHGGNIAGYTSSIAIVPEKQADVIVLSNTMDRIPYIHRYDLINILFDGCEKPDNDLFGEDALRAAFKKAREEYVREDTSLTDYEGKYRIPGFEKSFEVHVTNGRLVAEIPDKKFVLDQAYQDTFISEALIFRFIRDKNNKVTTLALDGEKFRNLELARF
jgi:CubicO group peptidase (beta-lactamase class C family)